MTSWNIRVDVDDALREVDRVGDLPGLDTILALEGVLADAFNGTQQAVHIITGSLKGSGSLSSTLADDVWSGEVSYGGPSPGFVNDPVRYAWYEQRRRLSHDFMAPARDQTKRFADAVSDAVKG